MSERLKIHPHKLPDDWRMGYTKDGNSVVIPDPSGDHMQTKVADITAVMEAARALGGRPADAREAHEAVFKELQLRDVRATLAKVAQHWAQWWNEDKHTRRYLTLVRFTKGHREGVPVSIEAESRDQVLHETFNMDRKDEYEILMPLIRAELKGAALAEWDRRVAEEHHPRSDETFKAILEKTKPIGHERILK